MERSAKTAFRDDVVRIFGDDLVSLTLFGPALDAASAPPGGVSALLVARTLRESHMKALRGAFPPHARSGVPYPALFTEALLRESADVFPLECLAMAGKRELLAGEDVAASLPLSRANLRHQVEFELKSKLLTVRRLYLSAPDGKALSRLPAESAASVLSAARGLVLLMGGEAPHEPGAILDALEPLAGRPLPALREALGTPAGKRPESEGDSGLFRYLSDLESLCTAADRLPADGSCPA